MAPVYTPEQRQVIDAYRAWAETQNLSQAQAARKINCSEATLSRLYSYQYPSRVEQHVRAMARVLGRHEDAQRAPSRVPFAQTSLAAHVWDALRTAHAESVLVAILGPTRIGKSEAARHYCEREPDTVYIAASVTATPYALLRHIAGLLRVRWQGSVYDMQLALTEHLAGTDRLIIIDEIDHIREPSLQVLRMLQDGSRVGMAWIGTESFLDGLAARRSSTINQVLGRVVYLERLGPLTPDDIALIAEPYGLDDEALAALVTGAQGQAGRAAAALVNARRGGRRVTARTLEQAFAMLMPVVQGAPEARNA